MHELVSILNRFDERLSRIEERLESNDTPQFDRTWYTVAETATLLGKQPFTIREWCRLKRIHAKKRPCGRGRTSEWTISSDEIKRYLNDGLLPLVE
ncbi:MAG: helix-turn-helix domain-containing protein [Planctomycetales bacterium]|nr:helix-turn-helix domain-containing protein [Planctomycetales bacterium]